MRFYRFHALRCCDSFKRRVVLTLVLTVMSGKSGSPVVAAPIQLWHGLTVNRTGVICRNGRPFRGIGVNFVGILRQLLRHADDRSVVRDLKALAAFHIPFVRFPAMPVWGSAAHRRAYVMNIYENHPQRYFHAMNRLCMLAHRYHIGLIPSLFFTLWPDALAHEHGLAVWNNPHSRTFHIWRDYTIAMVHRYEFNPAIWGWEFGNELNLKMDLPHPSRHFRGYTPAWGYTHAQMWRLYQNFADLVRRYDAYHLIEAGNSRPRRDSWHLMTNHEWKPDTPAEWARMLERDNAAFGAISIHEYGPAAADQIRVAARWAALWHKPLFVEEFGVPGPPSESRHAFMAILHAIVRSNVSLAAVWAFDERQQTRGNQDFSITATNDRRFMLKAIEAANVELRREN